MSKSKEELNILKGKYEDVVNEIRELTPEELEQVTGGVDNMVVLRQLAVLMDGKKAAFMRYAQGKDIR